MAAQTQGILDVYALTSTQRQALEEALRDARALQGPNTIGAETFSSAGTPRHSVLTFTPQLAGFAVSPEKLSMAWAGRMERASFVIAPSDGTLGERRGVVEVTQGDLLIAQLQFTIHVIEGQHVEPEFTSARAHPVERIFASYSHADRDLVDGFAELYRGLGIELFVDHRSLRTGMNWEAGLYKAIRDCDVFQLFWSEASAVSKQVTREWRYAYETVAPTRQEGFIRPVYWVDPLPPVPEPLNRLQFGRVSVPTLEDPSRPMLLW